MKSIRSKVIIILIAIGIIITMVLATLLYFTTQQQAKILDQESALRNIQRTEKVFQQQIESLSRYTKDYATWDDSYEFINDKNETYINSNLSASTYVNLHIDTIIYLDTQKNVFFDRSFNHKTGEESITNPILLEKLPASIHSSKVSQGIFVANNELYVFAAHPITTSNGAAPANGVLIMAREMTQEQLDDLQEISTQKITIEIVPTDVLEHQPTVYTTLISNKEILASIVLKDISGNLVAKMSITLPRTVYLNHQKDILINSAAFGFAVTLLVIACYFLIDRFILNRLLTLFDSIHTIAKQKDFQTQLKVRGNDEISQLAASVNSLLETVDKSQQNLQQQSEKLEQLLATREEQYMLQLNTQKAMLNLLEDEKDLQDQIKHDKEMVERTVDERTKELANKNIALEQAHKDISDAWLSVQREKARLTASINSLPNGFILTDQDGNVFMINNAAKYILGMTENIYELRAFSQTIKEGFNIEEIVQHTKEEKTIQKKHDVAINGKIINITVVPILLEPNNQFLGTAIVIDDVTERKIMERARDEFFSIASHELRTPLTSIRGNTAMIVQYFADILNEKTELKEMIDDIHSSSVRLISIVNDFLNVSRLEMKRMTYKYSDFNIVDLITKVHKELEPNAAEKHDTVTLQTSSDSLPLVHADPDRVKEVLLNLIGNAIKFTDNGSVTTHVRMENTHIRVEVTDSGLGIPQKQQDLLFRKFQQAEENIYTRDTSKSSGLGLYISKLLIEEMKGTIGLARSEEGKGSTFYFTLPIQNEEHSSEQHEPMKLNT